MTKELILAIFIMAIGLSVAGAGTHLYQLVARGPAVLSYAGKTFLASLGHLAVSFICGPYIMLQMGWRTGEGVPMSVVSALVAAFVAFGWAFITGMLFLSVYFAVTLG
jgi:Family of unknown function (DUF6949)